MGVYGKIKLALCHVYDSGQKGYVQLTGFDELITPFYKQGYIFEEWGYDADEYGINYRVYWTRKVLSASMYWRCERTLNPAYTEKILIDGKMVATKENVPEEEIGFRERC